MRYSERPKGLGRPTRFQVASNVSKDCSNGPLGDTIQSMYLRRAFCLVNTVISEEVPELIGGKLARPVSVKSIYPLGSRSRP